MPAQPQQPSRSFASKDEPHPGQRRGGAGGVRGNSFANGPAEDALHRWPCSCRWCLEGSVPEQSG
jgi:hypothetical protein